MNNQHRKYRRERKNKNEAKQKPSYPEYFKKKGHKVWLFRFVERGPFARAEVIETPSVTGSIKSAAPRKRDLGFYEEVMRVKGSKHRFNSLNLGFAHKPVATQKKKTIGGVSYIIFSDGSYRRADKLIKEKSKVA